MEVILLKDFKSIGKKGEIKNVSDGYANNYLIPNKIAVKKTEESISTLKSQQAAEDARQAKLKEIALENKGKIESITLEYKVKAQADGTMSKNISYKEIEQTLKNEYNIEIDKRKIVDNFKINAFGVTTLKVELYKGVLATIKIHVGEAK